MGRRGAIGYKRKGTDKNAHKADAHKARAAERDSANRVLGRPHKRPRTTSPTLERTRKRTASVEARDVKRRRRTSEPDARAAVKFVFERMGEPSPSNWPGRGGTAATIMSKLEMEGTPRRVKRTLDSIWNDDYSPRSKKRGGWTRKLSLVECEIAADQLARGVGLTQTLFNVNDMRRSEGRSEVGRTTLRDNVKAQLGAKQAKTTKRPTGNKDTASTWRRRGARRRSSTRASSRKVDASRRAAARPRRPRRG